RLRLAEVSTLALPSFVTRLGFRIHGIEAGERRPLVHLVHDPAFHALLLGALLEDRVELGGRDQYGTIRVDYDHVAGKDRDTAASNRLLPRNEREARDGRRGGTAPAPYGKASSQHARDVAHHAIRHETGNALLDHARAENVAEDAGVRLAH